MKSQRHEHPGVETDRRLAALFSEKTKSEQLIRKGLLLRARALTWLLILADAYVPDARLDPGTPAWFQTADNTEGGGRGENRADSNELENAESQEGKEQLHIVTFHTVKKVNTSLMKMVIFWTCITCFIL